MIIAVDWLTRWAEAKAVNRVDAEMCSDFIYTDVCCRYNVPESLRSDHGRSFDNEVFDNLSRLLKMNHHMSTPYYPQSHGLVERLVQTFKDALKCSIQDQIAGADGECDEPSPSWSHLVLSMLYAYRSTPHSALGMSPLELLFCRNLRLPGNHFFPSLSVSPDHKAAILHRIQFLNDVLPTLRARPPPRDVSHASVLFEVGDKVWVRNSKYDVGLPPVFAPPWKGPFLVKDRLDKNIYRLCTNPETSGKRSITLALPINGSRRRKASEQELADLTDWLQRKAWDQTVDVSFTLPVSRAS